MSRKQVVIDDGLHKRVRIFCAKNGMKIKEFINKAIESALCLK